MRSGKVVNNEKRENEKEVDESEKLENKKEEKYIPPEPYKPQLFFFHKDFKKLNLISKLGSFWRS